MLTPYEEMIFVLENFRFPIEGMELKVKEQAEKFKIELYYIESSLVSLEANCRRWLLRVPIL